MTSISGPTTHAPDTVRWWRAAPKNLRRWWPTAVCDFSLQSDTEGLVRELLAGGRKIDVLVNNAGVLNHKLTLTAEGREQTFTTNLLCELLLE